MPDEMKCPKCGIPDSEIPEDCNMTIMEALDVLFNPLLLERLGQAEKIIRSLIDVASQAAESIQGYDSLSDLTPVLVRVISDSEAFLARR
jgi:hypothetical protein